MDVEMKCPLAREYLTKSHIFTALERKEEGKWYDFSEGGGVVFQQKGEDKEIRSLQ